MSSEDYVRHVQRKIIFEDKKNAFLAKLEEAHLAEEFDELEREEEELKQAEKLDWSLYGALALLTYVQQGIYYHYLLGATLDCALVGTVIFFICCAADFVPLIYPRDGPAERWTRLSWRDVLYAKPHAFLMRTFYWTLATLPYLTTVFLIRLYLDVDSLFPYERVLTLIVGVHVRYVIWMFKWQSTVRPVPVMRIVL